MNTKRSREFSFILLIFNTLCFGLLSSCASYRFGGSERTLPAGIKTVTVPQFVNQSMETGVEVYFTNAMRDEFNRYKVGRMTDGKYADATVKGTITNITYTPGSKQTSGSSAPYLPEGAVIAAEYRIQVTAKVEVIRNSDGASLWSGNFNGDSTYTSPQVTLSGLNTVDPLYNLSSRRSNIQSLAQQMMVEAFNRMTENF